PIMVLYTPRSGDWGRRRRPKAANRVPSRPRNRDLSALRSPARTRRGTPTTQSPSSGSSYGPFSRPKGPPKDSLEPPTDPRRRTRGRPGHGPTPHEPHEGEMASRFDRNEVADPSKISNDS